MRSTLTRCPRSPGECHARQEENAHAETALRAKNVGGSPAVTTTSDSYRILTEPSRPPGTIRCVPPWRTGASCVVSSSLAAVLALSSITLTACFPSVAMPSNAKPLLVGLVDKGSEASYHLDQPYPVVDLSDVAAQSGAFGGVVVNQTWAQLRPTQGNFDFSTLDASLAAVTAYNAQHASTPIGVRLRVFAAFVAPAWAKSLDGTPITVPAHAPSNAGGTLGQWWKPGYRSAWASLQHALAARYDSNPVLREVAVSSCTTLTAEPFVMAPAPSP